MSKRRLKRILELSCGTNDKPNVEKNQTFNDFLSAAEFVFEDYETGLVNFGNVENDVNIMLQTENILKYTDESNIIIFDNNLQNNVECESINSLELNLIEDNVVICNENLIQLTQNDLLDVESLNEVNCIGEDYEEIF